jgi:hypothetical protein
MGWQPEDSHPDEVPIQIDAYGIKLRGAPKDTGEPTPATWGAVWAQMNEHLRRIAVGSTGVIAEVLEGGIRIVRGISSLPGAVSDRIRGAHGKADAVEEQRQAEVLQPSPDEALGTINRILEKYRALGYEAYITNHEDGRVMIALGTPPGSQAAVVAAVEGSRVALTPGEPEPQP